MCPAACLSHGTGVRIPVAVPSFAHDSREGGPLRSHRASAGRPTFAVIHGKVAHQLAVHLHPREDRLWCVLECVVLPEKSPTGQKNWKRHLLHDRRNVEQTVAFPVLLAGGTL